MSILNGVLSVCPRELEFYKDTNLNKQDLYCYFYVAGEMFKSDICSSHEDHPRWEKKLINAQIASDKNFGIFVYKKDKKDTVVAEATISLDCAKEGSLAKSWVGLEDHEGNNIGRVLLEMEFLSNIPVSHCQEYFEAVNKPIEEQRETTDKSESQQEKMKIKSKPKRSQKEKQIQSKSLDDTKIKSESKTEQKTEDKGMISKGKSETSKQGLLDKGKEMSSEKLASKSQKVSKEKDEPVKWDKDKEVIGSEKPASKSQKMTKEKDETSEWKKVGGSDKLASKSQKATKEKGLLDKGREVGAGEVISGESKEQKMGAGKQKEQDLFGNVDKSKKREFNIEQGTTEKVSPSERF